MTRPLWPIPTVCAALLLGMTDARAQERRPSQQNPPPLPAQPVLPLDPPELPLVPNDIDLFDANPEAPTEMPRKKQKEAADAMHPVLPELEPRPDLDLLGPQVKIFVKRFKFRGNTVFSDRQLARVIKEYEGREITSDELEAARVALTKHYVDVGYINSGAVLPDQDPTQGVVEFELVEGRLTEIDLSGNRWFRAWWLRHVLRRAAGDPVNFNHLKTGLQLLRQNPGISKINAELKPGAKAGDSILHVTVQDEHPFRLGFELSNKRPPSVSEGVGELYFSDLNLTGHNDPLDLRWTAMRWTKDGEIGSAGFDEFQASYEFPISPWDTTLRLSAGRGASSIIDETFAALGITSANEEISATLRQPILQTLRNTITLSVGVDRRHSETFLLGQPFTLSPGAIDGESDIFALRASAEWVNRSQVHVLAVRSTFSWGLDAFGATRDEGGASGVTSGFGGPALDVPDGKFFAWLGQVQYVQRIFDTPALRKKPETRGWNILRETTLIARANAQLTDEPLLALEQFSLGGVQSVRGYRENQLLRDNGVFGSVELRVPVWMRADKTPIVTIAPFFDIGTGWNTVSDDADDASETICSAGLGLLVNVNKHVQASIYWGHPFKDLITTRDSLQDYGIHFSISVNAW
jgi:hemolysin activation/secretion protein